MIDSVVAAQLLKPIVGFLIRRGVTFKQFSAISKALYVAVAEQELRETGAPISTSSVSVLTGLHRSDVKELLGRVPAPDLKPSVVSSVISRWEGEAKFCARNGKPRPLTFAGQDAEFRQLVLSVSTHCDPAAVLREMERTKNIEKQGELVALVRGEVRAAEDATPILRTLAKDYEALTAAVEQNLYSPIKGFSQLHISTEYDNIILDDIPRLRAWLVDRGKAFHRDARAEMAQSDADIAPREDSPTAGGHIIVGTFAYVKPIVTNDN